MGAENCRVVKDYENYLIYKDGRVFNKNFKRFLDARIDNSGYYVVMLSKDGIVKNHSVHRLIALHFLEQIENKTFVDHIDNNKLNNSLENLRFCNRQENGMNRSFNKNNKLGIKGISVNTNKSNYQARIEFNKKQYRKYFPLTPEGLEQAILWRNNMSLELCPNFHKI